MENKTTVQGNSLYTVVRVTTVDHEIPPSNPPLAKQRKKGYNNRAVRHSRCVGASSPAQAQQSCNSAVLPFILFSMLIIDFEGPFVNIQSLFFGFYFARFVLFIYYH